MRKRMARIPDRAFKNRSVQLTFLAWRTNSPVKEAKMATTNSRRGFFRNALDSIIDARARQAQSYVNGALLMLDDATLAANGYKRAELEKSARAPYMF